MASANITKSIISITSPGTYLIPGDNASARILSRQVNEFAADLKRRRPTQFGFWASLPLPDVQGSIDEINFALDHLCADGVAVMSNAWGIYLGDSRLDPVFAELNRRNATVFIHPTSPHTGIAFKGNATNVQNALPLPQYPAPMFEFFFDTARTIINMFISGSTNRFPGVTYVVSHCGGALPPIIDRFAGFATVILQIPGGVTAADVRATFARQFYFDLAGFTFPDQVTMILRYITPSRLTYGSDYPYTAAPGALGLEKVMDASFPTVFPDNATQAAVYRGNAQTLLAKSDMADQGWCGHSRYGHGW